MRKNLIFSVSIVLLALTLSGCGKTENQTGKTEKSGEAVTAKDSSSKSADKTKDADNTSMKACAKEKVSLPNYGDPGQRLSNCFVEFPGEPSRQDKSYYIVEDICGQFTKEFMENMYGAKLDRIELPQVATINNCTYYFDEKKNVMLNLEYLSAENQKKGNEAMDRKVEKSSQIPMDNMVTYQEDGAINVIYLILGPNKFISMRPSSKAAIEKEKFIALAANIAQAIKDYK